MEYHLRLDLHGLRAEVARERVEALIYARRGVRLEIVHGCGHGILRSVVRETVAECPCVREVRYGETENLPGGSGVTVVYTFE